jgi:hypothetical protein
MLAFVAAGQNIYSTQIFQCQMLQLIRNFRKTVVFVRVASFSGLYLVNEDLVLSIVPASPNNKICFA